MIPIFDAGPSDWKDLEFKVSKIFADIGFSVEVEKDISLVRGKVNVHFIAIKKHLTTEEIHIAECNGGWNLFPNKSCILSEQF
jgi:hypothetical protein